MTKPKQTFFTLDAKSRVVQRKRHSEATRRSPEWRPYAYVPDLNRPLVHELAACDESRVIAKAASSEDAFRIASALERTLPSERKLCRCPIGGIRSDCPFSYANGWHEQRDAMLLRVEVTLETSRLIRNERDRLTDEELDQL